MDKTKTILMSILIFLSLGTAALFDIVNKEENEALKFKEEYEKLNSEYLSIEVSENNPMVYKSVYDMEDLSKKNAIFYLGYPESNWCRRIVPTLISATKKISIKEIYYFDLSADLRVPLKISDIYPEYCEINDESEDKETPAILFIKDGKIIKAYYGTEELIEDTDALKEEMVNYLNEIAPSTCDDAC